MPRLLAVVAAAALFSGCSSKSDSPGNAPEAAAASTAASTSPKASKDPKGAEWDILIQKFTDLYRAGNYDRALTVAKKALKVAEKNAGPHHPDVATSLNNLALLSYSQSNFAQAEPLYKRSLAIWEKALGPDHPHVATNLENMALLYRATNRQQEAEKLEQRAERIRAGAVQ